MTENSQTAMPSMPFWRGASVCGAAALRVLQGKRTLRFYVHCTWERHKLDCLKSDDRVFVKIDRGESLITADNPCGYGAAYQSVLCRGVAAVVENPAKKCRGLAILVKTQTVREYDISEKMADTVTVIRIDAVSCTAKSRIRRTEP